MTKKSIIIFFFLLFSFNVFGKVNYVYSDTNENILIGEYIYLLEDKRNEFDSKFVFQNDSLFVKSNDKVLNLGISKSSFWVNVTIENKTTLNELYLELEYPTLDHIEFYKKGEKGLVLVDIAGDFEKYTKRKFNYQNYIFSLSIPKDSACTYYFKIKTGEQLLLPIYVRKLSTLNDTHLVKDLIFGIFAGIIFVMFLYNFFIYITVKDKSYLYYVIYIALVGLTQACLQGYTYRYLWPDSPNIAILSVFVFTALVGIAALQFIKLFLQLSIHYKKILPFLYFLQAIYFICIILALLGHYNESQILVQITALVASFFAFFVGVKISQKGYKPALFFLIAWTVFIIGVVLFVLKDIGVLPYNSITNYTMQIGSAIEAILLSFALADRINILKKEKESSQAQTLIALRENERIITEQNVFLETKVTERTSELKKSNNELNTTLSELKQTQSQLVNAEKMASLGQLTAGIAHEINNPINFVVSNVKPLRRDIEDIYELVKKYEQINLESNLNNDLESVSKFKNEIDYDYIKEEISILLKGIEEGAIRTADIVKGLRVFSRLDENDLKRTNILEGLDSTLSLLNTEINGYIDLEKKYSDLPAIECYPGKLNQVFMNILNNAIFAIKENKTRVEKGLLIITATSDDKFVKLSIKDNGIGMSDAVKLKIFEPFFTTKDVGKGTGLGMSITFSIINDHNGKIEVETALGKGTEFILYLPINNR